SRPAQKISSVVPHERDIRLALRITQGFLTVDRHDPRHIAQGIQRHWQPVDVEADHDDRRKLHIKTLAWHRHPRTEPDHSGMAGQRSAGSSPRLSKYWRVRVAIALALPGRAGYISCSMINRRSRP